MDYQKIKKDFENGILNPTTDVLVVDYDSCWLQSNDSTITEEERDSKYEEYQQRYGMGEGSDDFSLLLNYYGIPNTFC